MVAASGKGGKSKGKVGDAEAGIPPPPNAYMQRLFFSFYILGLHWNGAFGALRLFALFVPREGMLGTTLGAGENIAALFPMKSAFTAPFTATCLRLVSHNLSSLMLFKLKNNHFFKGGQGALIKLSFKVSERKKGVTADLSRRDRRQ
jgi:hypothetical protein